LSTSRIAFLATIAVACLPAAALHAAEQAADQANGKPARVAKTAREFGIAVKDEAVEVGHAVKKEAKQVGVAVKREAKKVQAAIKGDHAARATEH